MKPREQFAFYRSYRDALRSLPKRDRLLVYDAVCDYALDEKEPELTEVPLAVFTLIRPTLDAGRRKAFGGQNGTPNGKDNGKSGERQRKAGGKEKEGEKEGEKEKEYECTPPTPSEVSEKESYSFSDFWDRYPSRKGGEAAAREAWEEVVTDALLAKQLMAALEVFSKSTAWTMEDGRYIPSAMRFLKERHWEKPPVLSGSSALQPSLKLGQSELEAIRRVLREAPDDDKLS